MVQMLDPLAADETLRTVPAMNARRDLRGLVDATRRIASGAEIGSFSRVECLAAMRDLGMLLGSLKRHGAEPLDAVPEVEPILLALGARTGMVPRDTLHHYTGWNPHGARERTYTGDPMEVQLIRAVRVSLPRIGRAILLCETLSGLDVADPLFAAVADDIVGCLQTLALATDIVRAQVSPRFFARVLRPYFEEIRVGGRSYHGPAAAQVPLAIIDVALWASDHAGPEYADFSRNMVEYSPLAWRASYERWRRQPSLVSRVAAGLETQRQHGCPRTAKAATAVAAGLRALTVFRSRHLRIARQACTEDIQWYEVGSGAGSTAMLAEILALTRQNADLVRTA